MQHETVSQRRKRDSNPRFRYRNNGFQDRRIRPLCHFSFEAANLQTFMKLNSSDAKICQILTYPDLKLIKLLNLACYIYICK